MRDRLEENEVTDLMREAVEDAINAGCLTVQKRLGVTDGGFAAVFFTDRADIEALFRRYILIQDDEQRIEDQEIEDQGRDTIICID